MACQWTLETSAAGGSLPRVVEAPVMHGGCGLLLASTLLKADDDLDLNRNPQVGTSTNLQCCEAQV